MKSFSLRGFKVKVVVGRVSKGLRNSLEHKEVEFFFFHVIFFWKVVFENFFLEDDFFFFFV